MNDWYTPEVQAALEIVPVEWPMGMYRCRLRVEGSGWVADRMIDVVGHHVWESDHQAAPFEAQASIEKTFREWLAARGINVFSGMQGHVVFHYRASGYREELGIDGEWYRQGNRFETYIQALAAGIIAEAKT